MSSRTPFNSPAPATFLSLASKPLTRRKLSQQQPACFFCTSLFRLQSGWPERVWCRSCFAFPVWARGCPFRGDLQRFKADIWVGNVQLSLSSLLPPSPLLQPPRLPMFLQGLAEEFSQTDSVDSPLSDFRRFDHCHGHQSVGQHSPRPCHKSCDYDVVFDFKLTPSFLFGITTALAAAQMCN